MKYFKSKKAQMVFDAAIKRLEAEIMRNAATDYSEMLNLYVDNDTGQILMWFKENDPLVGLLDDYYLHLFRKIVWHMSDGQKKAKGASRGNGTRKKRGESGGAGARP